MVQTKINYDLWANQLVIDRLQKMEDEELLHELTRLFAHLFKAQIIWHNRVNNIDERTEIWGEYTLEECHSLLNDSHAMLDGIAAGIGRTIAYQNSKGMTFTNRVEDIFEHVIIHGQHHRAQIYQLMRNAGFTPPTTDYIFYVRSL